MKRQSFITALVLLLTMTVLMVAGPSITKTETNLQVKGWLFGNAATKTWAGQTTWATTGTADTLLVSGVDTTCIVMITAKTATGELRYDVAAAGDTIFITSSGSETGGTDKYAWLIIRNAYGATN